MYSNHLPARKKYLDWEAEVCSKQIEYENFKHIDKLLWDEGIIFKF